MHYLDDVRAGGSLRVGQLLANNLPPDEVESRILFAYGNKGPVGEQSTVRVDYAHVKGRWDLGGWLRVRKYITEFKPDILHFQDPLVVCRIFLSGLPGRRLTHCHGRPLNPPTTRAQKFNAWWLKRDTDLFVCIDAVAAQTLEKFNLARKGQCVLLANGVDFEWLQQRPTRTGARNALSLPADKKIMGMVCRVVEHKGIPDLFRQLKFLPDEWHGAIFGDGPDRDKLQAQARQLNLSDRIHFVGALNDVRSAYAAMDAYFFACAHEPFGLVLAEAMACDVPVFGLHGLGEYRQHHPPLIDESVAILLERGNVARLHDPKQAAIPEADEIYQTLARKIADYGEDDEISRRMIAAARERVRGHFDIHTRAAKLMKIYRDILSR